jgi:hypothetical protein
LITRALKILEDPKKNVLFVEELCVVMGVNKTTFYSHKLNENNEIKEGLRSNKEKTKAAMRGKWFRSENPALNLALYKLLATNEERQILSTNYHNHGGQNGENPVQHEHSLLDEFIAAKRGQNEQEPTG